MARRRGTLGRPTRRLLPGVPGRHRAVTARRPRAQAWPRLARVRRARRLVRERQGSRGEGKDYAGFRRRRRRRRRGSPSRVPAARERRRRQRRGVARVARDAAGAERGRIRGVDSRRRGQTGRRFGRGCEGSVGGSVGGAVTRRGVASRAGGCRRGGVHVRFPVHRGVAPVLRRLRVAFLAVGSRQGRRG